MENYSINSWDNADSSRGKKNSGKLFIISGPSGVGKNTLADKLLKHVGIDSLRKVITYTTRAARPKEINGKDYHFLSESEFHRMIKNSEFLEYAQVHEKNYYGSAISDIENILNSGINALLVIDTTGVESILRQNHKFDIITIFIRPQSLDQLKERIDLRGTENTEDIEIRLNTAKEEIKKSCMYDNMIISSSPKSDFFQLLEIYKSETNAHKTYL